MPKTPLVTKIRASGYLPGQIKKPKKQPASFTRKEGLSTQDTAKGQGRAFVSRNKMPVSIEPIKAPRSKTLAQIGREIRNV